jgi:hypothetical protein
MPGTKLPTLAEFYKAHPEATQKWVDTDADFIMVGGKPKAPAANAELVYANADVSAQPRDSHGKWTRGAGSLIAGKFKGQPVVLKITEAGHGQVVHGPEHLLGKTLLKRPNWEHALNLPDPGSLTVVKPMGGSTGAVLAQDAVGKQFIVKSGAGKAQQLGNELDADAAYRVAGVPVPLGGLVSHNGVPTKVTRLIAGEDLGTWLQGKPKAARDAMYKKIGEHFAADALFANWDVIGLSKDNILVDLGGTPHRIDNGGALKYRAQGSPKGAKFGDKVTELQTMRDATINPSAAEVYKHLTDHDVRQQMYGLVGKRQQILDAISDPETKATIGKRLDHYVELLKVPAAVTPEQAAAVTGKVQPHWMDDLLTSPTLPTPPTTTPTPSTKLHTAQGLADHVKSTAAAHGVKFTDLSLHKIAILNPNGLQGGVFYHPHIKNKEVGQVQGAHLRAVLPPGTKIVKINFEGKYLKEGKLPQSLAKKIGLTETIGAGFATDDAAQKNLEKLEVTKGKTGSWLEKAQHSNLTKIEKVVAQAADELKTDPGKQAGQQHVDAIAAKASTLAGTTLDSEDTAQILQKLGVPLKTTVGLPDPHAAQVPGLKQKAAKPMLKAHSEPILASLTAPERKYVKSYTGGGYHTVNSEMRKCPPPPPTFGCVGGHAKDMMENIQSALDKAPPFPQPVVVKRGISVSPSQAADMLKAANDLKDVGGHYHMPSFTSTSVAGGFGGNVKFEISARTGLYLPEISNYPHEQEVLLSPKARYRVLGTTSKGGSHVIQLEEVL